MKSYRDNGGGGGGFGARSKTVYDDVFGGPPKFGATTLPPRLEDYTEIFQGFHASRGSSIPVLDLPPPAEDSGDVWFDVHSSKLDYSEVFGGFNGLDFAVSYEELFGGSKVGEDDSSDEVWTPAQSESLSDESDPHASLETNQQVPTADPDQSFVMKKQFNLSQNMANLEVEKDVSSGIANVSQFHDVPRSTVVETEKLFPLPNNNHYVSKNFGGVTEGKLPEKSLSQPLDRGFGSGRYGSDLNHSMGSRPLLSVSDLSLKTQPSNLPPPSRPPPALTSKKGDSGRFSSKLKTSKSYAFERMTDDGSPPYFDVEIDASSSAAADAAAMKDAVEQAQAKLRSAKELKDRKKEGLQVRSKVRVDNNLGDKKGRVNEKSNIFVLETFEHEDGKNVNVREVCGLEENNVRQETRNKFHREEEPLKEPTAAQKACKPRETCKESHSEADVNELYENLIEIQLKDNEMVTGGKPVGANDKVVTENRLKNDDEMEGLYAGSDPFDWDNYDIGVQETIEKEHEMEPKETKVQDAKEVQKPDPPEIETIESEEEKDQERGESERFVEDPLGREENEKISVKSCEQEESDDNISEVVSEQYENEKEQTFLQEEDLMQEEDKKKPEEAMEQDETVNHAGTNEKIEAIHETDHNSEENIKLQKGLEREESKDIENEHVGAKWEEDERVEENDSSTGEHFEASDNEIQCDLPSEQTEATPETRFCLKNEELLNQNNLEHKAEVRTSDVTNSYSLNENTAKTQMENDKRTSELTSGLEKQKREDESRNKEKEEKLQRERELENERLRKLEEERERQIEREKDRMAVDRATLEARERAFAETRERAERAAVERATAEFRQRALAEARERLEKACAEARERSLAEKTSEGRLRVEKATAEARERAERSVVDKFSASKSNGMRQNSLSSDVPDSQFQKMGSYSGLRYSQTAAHSGGGGEGESPQRCKARLERHQRTADRAAKALAEKNMRDLIAQKEQAERNRFAEGLDAEVKRWSSGKQGNLRALLSTLQYILGSDSGWQPVPLTEVITTAAVKKAYRKATLCVHPDKLQQRGASIQQKYICEKVFDLLKEAWNKFNSEER